MQTVKTNKPLLLTLTLLSAPLCFALYAVRDTVFPDRPDDETLGVQTDSASNGSTEVSAVYIDEALPPLEAGMVNVTAGHAAYRVYPTGGSFARPVSVRIGYDTLKIPHGHAAAEVRTYRYDDSLRHWVKLPLDSVVEGAQQVQSRTSKGGDMINAIVQLPELPESQAFTPTMLQELEAAHPAAGITMMQAPEANSQGTASLSYPISVPAGRNGIQPNLNVSYSSGGGNGLLGMGWDMQLPAITVDSKWGVPRYDGTYETECYSYNGQELLPSPHYLSTWEHRNTTGNKRFRPRTEGSFDSIVRCGNGPAEYFWVVTDKSGTKYFYGSYDGVQPEMAVLLKDENGNIGHWPLCRVEDLDGNYMNYYYEIRRQSDGGVYLGQQLWPESIEYTGNRYTGERGAYRVFFGNGRVLPSDDGSGNSSGSPSAGGSQYAHVPSGVKPIDPDSNPGDTSYGGGSCNCEINVEIVKTDEYTGMPIKDVVFSLGGTNFRKTDSSGKAGWGALVPCNSTFCIRETDAPAAYCSRLEDFCFTVTDDTSIAGGYEVMQTSGATYTIKNHTLTIYVKNRPCPGTSYGDRPEVPGNLHGESCYCDCEDEYPYDLRTDARLGFLQSHKEKLRRMVVYYRDSVVRSYSFCYGQDIFGRAQLRKISQYGTDCSEQPYTHTFSYYRDADSVRLAGAEVTVANAGINADDYALAVPHKVGRALRNVTGNSLSGHSVIESSTQSSFGAGAGANVGIDPFTCSKINTLGLDLNYSHSSGQGNTSLMDVTGDGLPDMVFKGKNKVLFKQQLPDGGFANAQALRDFKFFLKDKSNGFGPSVSAKAGRKHGGLGSNFSLSRTTTYFSDMNGDGLPDMVSGDGAKAAVPVSNPFAFSCDECKRCGNCFKGNADNKNRCGRNCCFRSRYNALQGGRCRYTGRKLFVYLYRCIQKLRSGY